MKQTKDNFGQYKKDGNMVPIQHNTCLALKCFLAFCITLFSFRQDFILSDTTLLFLYIILTPTKPPLTIVRALTLATTRFNRESCPQRIHVKPTDKIATYFILFLILKYIRINF